MTDLNQRIAGLSPEKRALLEARLLKKAASEKPSGIGAAAVPSELELSFSQESLWFLDRLEPNSSFYIIPQAMRIRGPLNLEALRKSFETVVNRHEALRTQIVPDHGRPRPRLVQNVHFQIALMDLRGLAAEKSASESSRLIAAEAKRPFDLENDLMLRVTLLRLAENEHVLVLTIHHIASDLWSFTVLFKEVSALYGVFCKSASAALPPILFQYSDFAHTQREFLQGDKFQEQLAHWKEKLSGNLPELELPTDHPRPQVQNFRGARKYIHIPLELASQLKMLSQREKATAYITLLTAFQVLLHRYSGQEDIIVGSPLGGRGRIETEQLIGYFVNPLVLRLDLSGDPTFHELLHRSREAVFNAFANQDIPFERLVDELRVPRNPGRNPVFQVMFQFQPTPEPRLHLDGTEIELIELESGTSKLDLIFTLTESEKGDGWVGNLEYNTDLYEGGTVERMLVGYGCLLESVVAGPGEKISRLNLLRAPERQKLLVEWNQTATEYPRGKCIDQLFEEQVEKTPEAIALVFGEQTLTYGELNQRADQLAQHLCSLGVGPDALVGLCLDRSLELVVSILAILKAGGAYVPLDATFPEERLRFMLEDTGVSILITDKPFPFSNARKVDPKKFPRTNEAGRSLKVESSPDNLAYVMYTSGSTGQPKGVAVPHRGVVRLVMENDFMRFGPGEVFLQFAPVSFDASTLELWGALLHGARLVIYPPQLPSLAELGAVLQQQRVTTLWLTAGLFHQMVEHQIEGLRGVKQLLAGGDVLSVPHVRKVLEQLPDCQLINGYGPTESTTFACCYSVPKNWTGRSVPIGRPIRNTQVYILDSQLQPAPIGVPGELLIGGDGLARGYLNRPELTAEKFIPHPFRAGERLYQTGDKVRWLADGTIEFLGRMDHQVKIRGYRIEPGEIEAVLATHPNVRQAALTLHTNPHHEKYLVAYVSLKTRHDEASSEIKQFLQQKLPRYMVPSALVIMDELPLNANGKIDRRALAPPETSDDPAHNFAAPRTELEKKVFAIWQDVLGRSNFGVRENFFELGGHSLLATQVISRISQNLKIELSLRKIFELPTIELLALEIQKSPRSIGVERPLLARRSRRVGSAEIERPPNKEIDSLVTEL